MSGFKRVGLVRMREREPLLVFSTKWEAASVSNRNTEKKSCSLFDQQTASSPKLDQQESVINQESKGVLNILSVLCTPLCKFSHPQTMAVFKEFRVTMQFRVNQKVEIRTQESGFHGSWMRATVIDSSKQSYHVQYDNLLQLEDGAEKLVEVVTVTPTNTVSSSRLRPMPPMVSFGVFDLSYGLCVDVYDKGSWLEGVIFDHEDGSNERIVLLLESGRERKIKIESLRIGQEWDVFTGVWKLKGTWPLIGLFEGCEKDQSVLYGTCMIVDSIPRENLLIDHEGGGVVMNAVDSDDVVLANSDKDSCNRVDMVTDCKIMDVVDSDGVFKDGSQVVITGKNRANGDYMSIGYSNGEGLLGANGKRLGKRGRKSAQKGFRWVPAGPDLLPAAEFCPGAITRYASHGNQRPPEPLLIDVRKHLAYVGWKIECKKYGSAYKFRYTSPDGSKTYFSLRLLCLDMRDPTIENSSLISQDLINDVKKSSGIDYPRKSKRTDEFSQFPSRADSQGRNDDVGLLGDSELRHQQDQNASLPRPMREKTIETLRKLRDYQKSNQEQNASPLKQRRGKVIETLEKPRDGQKRQSSRTAMQGVTPRSSKCKPRCALSWMIDNNLVSPGEKVSYRGSKGPGELTRGRITREGIECNCCQKIFTLTGFESHAGSTNHRPAANIILEDGRSLLDCQRKKKPRIKMQRVTREAKWKGRQNQHQGETDYICSVCHDGGDLIVCDHCPSTFHKNCVGLDDIPEGEWFCPPCCCGICGENKFKYNVQEPKDSRLLSCDQCERKYHIGCLRNKGVVKLKRKDPKDSWFCSNKCEDIFIGLQTLLGKSVVVGPDNLTWTLWKFMESDSCDVEAPTGKHSKLDLAVEVIHECFEPATETYTGRDIAEDVIFSRECILNRLNFRGFYTVLLERNDELIAVANVRVFGDKVAEIPLVGTRFLFRRLGMCKILMDELEKQLMNLGVERLMLPAVPSVLDTWINGFGFSKLTDAEKMQYLDRTFLDFPGTIKCLKVLL